ncbi:hypothetical protein [Aestuariivirga sp.]|uniref:hypothetical protein n=1 Tax=Aestuariivirga sp. TaxID=2650926 RepID=UPI0039192D27
MPPKTTPPKEEAKDLRPEDFEKIREAVLETPRGRWFLDEFASRLRAAESASLVSSMKRLETAVAANHDALMARLAEALRRGPAPSQASAPQPELAPRHMKYYRQDEEIFTPAPHATIAEVPAAEAKEKPRKEERRRPARVIRRQGPAFEPPPGMEAPLPTSAVAPPPEPLPPAAAGEPTPAAKRRIVIIRHKPGEEIDVPLADELARAS